jgi:hypothetical protein
MSAVLMVLCRPGGVAASELAMGELSRRVRFLVGDSGAAAAAWGLDCVVKSSLIVLPECLRLSVPVLADIGRERRLWSCTTLQRAEVDDARDAFRPNAELDLHVVMISITVFQQCPN